MWTVSINSGLFSHIGYKRDEPIVTFKGVWKKQSEWKELAEKEPCRRAYSIAKSEHGDVLDCYDHFVQGLCVASYANCPIACKDIITNEKAKDNCRITIYKNVITLRCGVNSEGRESPKKFFIPPDTELGWSLSSRSGRVVVKKVFFCFTIILGGGVVAT